MSVGLADLPGAVSNLVKVASLSSKTSATLTWDLAADVNAPAGAIRGYRLYMIDPSAHNEEVLIWDGNGLAQLNLRTVSGLTTGNEYRFSVAAINFNGEGTRSSWLSVHACNAPSSVPKPLLVSSTSSQMIISWGSVQDTGGCPITGFAVYRDD